ncbi:MAG: DUF4249 domain-containing protein [Bacteroidales bacterium]|nr:MAG: DUF4249 domain-containing protein [Bacteroidales bacterium]
MRAIRLIFILWLTVIVLQGCIEPFSPVIDDYQEMLVIDGLITDKEGIHTVTVSRSSLYNKPGLVYESGCIVNIYDNNGNIINLTEQSQGIYSAWLEQQFLNAGTQYRLEVITSDGSIYQSGFETLFPCPPIDSISYEVISVERDNPLYGSEQGAQFYIDSDAANYEAGGYRWELFEQWEYRSRYYAQDYFDGHINHVSQLGISDSVYYCWSPVRKINEIYTYSTSQAISKEIRKLPLTYVSNQTERLKFDYCLLAKQYSLSETAFSYWKKLQEQANEAGGLYERQPSRITGNVYNVDDPDETVLGFFGASGISEKRVFLKKLGYLYLIYDIYYEQLCDPVGYSPGELMEFLNGIDINEYPIYLYNYSGTAEGPWDYIDQACVNCLLRGGDTLKPSYWE